MPDNFLLTLAYFEHSGRGVACTRDIEVPLFRLISPTYFILFTSHFLLSSRMSPRLLFIHLAGRNASSGDTLQCHDDNFACPHENIHRSSN